MYILSDISSILLYKPYRKYLELSNERQKANSGTVFSESILNSFAFRFFTFFASAADINKIFDEIKESTKKTLNDDATTLNKLYLVNSLLRTGLRPELNDEKQDHLSYFFSLALAKDHEVLIRRFTEKKVVSRSVADYFSNLIRGKISLFDVNKEELIFSMDKIYNNGDVSPESFSVKGKEYSYSNNTALGNAIINKNLGLISSFLKAGYSLVLPIDCTISVSDKSSTTTKSSIVSSPLDLALTMGDENVNKTLIENLLLQNDTSGLEKLFEKCLEISNSLKLAESTRSLTDTDSDFGKLKMRRLVNLIEPLYTKAITNSKNLQPYKIHVLEIMKNFAIIDPQGASQFIAKIGKSNSEPINNVWKDLTSQLTVNKQSNIEDSEQPKSNSIWEESTISRVEVETSPEDSKAFQTPAKESLEIAFAIGKNTYFYKDDIPLVDAIIHKKQDIIPSLLAEEHSLTSPIGYGVLTEGKTFRMEYTGKSDNRSSPLDIAIKMDDSNVNEIIVNYISSIAPNSQNYFLLKTLLIECELISKNIRLHEYDYNLTPEEITIREKQAFRLANVITPLYVKCMSPSMSTESERDDYIALVSKIITSLGKINPQKTHDFLHKNLLSNDRLWRKVDPGLDFPTSRKPAFVSLENKPRPLTPLEKKLEEVDKGTTNKDRSFVVDNIKYSYNSVPSYLAIAIINKDSQLIANILQAHGIETKTFECQIDYPENGPLSKKTVTSSVLDIAITINDEKTIVAFAQYLSEKIREGNSNEAKSGYFQPHYFRDIFFRCSEISENLKSIAHANESQVCTEEFDSVKQRMTLLSKFVDLVYGQILSNRNIHGLSQPEDNVYYKSCKPTVAKIMEDFSQIDKEGYNKFFQVKLSSGAKLTKTGWQELYTQINNTVVDITSMPQAPNGTPPGTTLETNELNLL